MASTLKFEDQHKKLTGIIVIVSIVTSILTAILLLVFVLPVFFGNDPLGLGARSGFIGKPVPVGTANATNNPQSVQQSVVQSENASSEATTIAIPQADDPLAVREDNIDVVIPPKQGLDYRLAMEGDYDLDYQWTANGKTVYSELRGEPRDGKAPSKMFGKLTSKSGKGFFIIPFDGQFGWHWQNKTDQPIMIRLHTKGHYQVVGQLEEQTPTH
jgi:hypothetical protein